MARTSFLRAVRLLATLTTLLAPEAGAAAATLAVTVHGVRNDRGHIRIGVCRKDEFLSESCLHHAVVPAHGGDVHTSIKAIPPGQYGVAVFQDEDDSGRLKRNFLGMPTEDVGFSRDPALRFGPPSFARSAISIGNADTAVALTLHHFGS